MEKLTIKTKSICIILAAVIIAGIIVITTVGFNVELNMKANNLIIVVKFQKLENI